jgi:hypothetical protein
MHAAIIRNLKEKTGRDLAEWIAWLRAEGPAVREAQVEWLKAKGLGTGQAWVVVEEAARPPDYREPTDEELIDAQYAGLKGGLRPIYSRVINLARQLGPVVAIGVRKTYVALIRAKKFAVVQPTTNTRVDVGLALAGETPIGRLQPAKNLGSSDRITHKIALNAASEANQELLRWLKKAYERAL